MLDETMFILGGGPSINTSPISRLRGCRCIAVNNTYSIAPWAEALWFGDVKWWDWHKQNFESLSMPIMTCCQNERIRKETTHEITFFTRDLKTRGISTIKGKVCWNGNSGASAINLAYWLNARRIVLVGFDMRKVDGQKNYHNEHKEKNHNPFKRHMKGFPAIRRDAIELGLEIVNATPGSAIQDFPITSLDEVLDELGL